MLKTPIKEQIMSYSGLEFSIGRLIAGQGLVQQLGVDKGQYLAQGLFGVEAEVTLYSHILCAVVEMMRKRGEMTPSLVRRIVVAEKVACADVPALPMKRIAPAS